MVSDTRYVPFCPQLEERCVPADDVAAEEHRGGYAYAERGAECEMVLTPLLFRGEQDDAVDASDYDADKEGDETVLPAKEKPRGRHELYVTEPESAVYE